MAQEPRKGTYTIKLTSSPPSKQISGLSFDQYDASTSPLLPKKPFIQGLSSWKSNRSAFQLDNSDSALNTTMPSFERLNTTNNDSLKPPSINISRRVVRKQSQRGNKLETEPSPKSLSPEKSERPTRILSEAEILENSKNLLKNIRSPKEIYQGAFELKIPNLENPKPHFGKNRLKTIAKKLNTTLDMSEEDEISRNCEFMKKIPSIYYQKLKEMKNKKPEKVEKVEKMPLEAINLKKPTKVRRFIEPESESKALLINEEKVRPQTPALKIPPLKANIRLESLQLKPSASQNPKDRQQNRGKRGNSFHCVTANFSDESSLSCERNEKVNMTCIEKPKEPIKEAVSKRTPKVSSNSKWIARTAQLRKDIDTLKVKTEKYMEFTEFCQEKLMGIIEKVGVKDVELEPGEEPASYWEHYDLEEVMKDVKDKTKMNSVMNNSGQNSNGKVAMCKNLQFYRNLLYKQQKTAEKTLMKLTTPKPKCLGQLGGSGLELP